MVALLRTLESLTRAELRSYERTRRVRDKGKGKGLESVKMVQYVITPWRHQSELLAVREALYGEGREVMAEGVERVGVWSKLSLPFFCFVTGVGLGWIE